MKGQIGVTLLFLLFSALVVGTGVSNFSNLTSNLTFVNTAFLNISANESDTVEVNFTKQSVSRGGNQTNRSGIITEIHEPRKKNRTKVKLARVLNEEGMDFDKKIRQKYLNHHRNFTALTFKEGHTLQFHSNEEKVKGVTKHNKNYAIDLMDCSSSEQYCIFLVNGIPTRKVRVGKERFDLDEHTGMAVTSVKKKCSARFCHLGYQGYHDVKVEIVEK